MAQKTYNQIEGEYLEFFELPNHEEIPRIVEHLNTTYYLHRDDWKTFMDYSEAINDHLSIKKLMLKHSTCPEKTAQMYTELESEAEQINHIKKFNMGRYARVSLHQLSCIVRFGILGNKNNGYSTDPFFEFKRLVEQINTWYHIDNPTKPSNKIAWGWKFSLDKGNSSDWYKGTRLYLFGCIKNYLIRNGIEFTKEISLEVRKIVCLVDIQPGDE